MEGTNARTRGHLNPAQSAGFKMHRTVLRPINHIKKHFSFAKVPFLNVYQPKVVRYSLTLQETVRSKDKEPYDNIGGNL
jgi:hypothetical protein